MTVQQEQLKVAFYIRVSTDEQVEKYGIDLQRTALEGLVKSKGKLEDARDSLVLAGDQYIYIDEGISGQTEPRERPVFAKLMEDIELAPEGRKPFDAIVVYKIDRFARRLKVLLDIVDFLELHDIKFLSANESIDTSSPFGKAILGILGVIAELEIENTKLRTQAGRQEAIDKGIYTGNAAPYGLQKDKDKRLVVLEEEFKIVKNIFEWFVYERLSVQKIADRLTSLSVLSPDVSAIKYEKRKGESRKKNAVEFWRLETVKDILSNRIYVGEYWYGKNSSDKNKKKLKVPQSEWKLSKYKYAPFIEPLLFEQAQKFLGLSAQGVKFHSGNIRGRIYPLSGIIKCASCAEGMQMISWTGDRKKLSTNPVRYGYYYKCARKNRKKFSEICTVLPVPAEPLEKYVINFLLKLLEDPKMVFKHQHKLLSSKSSRKRLQGLRKAHTDSLNGIPKRVDNIRNQNTLGLIDSSKMMEEVKKQEESKNAHLIEIDRIDKELGQEELSEGYLKSFEVFADKYKSRLADLANNLPELQSVIHTMVERITISSRPVVDIDSVAGKKRENQLMPNGIEIRLRLPEDILTMLASSGYGSGTVIGWGHWDSNPEPIA